MSRYSQVLERAGRDREFLPAIATAGSRIASQCSSLSEEGLAREAISQLVQRLFLLPGQQDAPRSVLFCGVEEGDGSGRICARAGQALAGLKESSVCLVDANLRGPGLHTRFGIRNQRGLIDALFEAGSVCDFAQQTCTRNLWLVPAGSMVPDALARLTAEALQRCLRELCARFRYLLFDAPAACSNADATVVGKQVDGVVLVVAANATRRETTRQAKASLEAAGVRLLGAVMENRSFPIPERIYRWL